MITEIDNIKLLIDNAYNTCEMIENEIPELVYRNGIKGKLKSILKENLIKYLVYVTHSEGKATYYYETYFINDILDTNYSFDEINEICEKEQLNNKLFTTTKSLILAIVIKAAEKYTRKSQTEKAKQILDKLFCLFKYSGYGLLNCSDIKSYKRKERLKKYLDNMERDVNITFKNLGINYVYKDYAIMQIESHIDKSIIQMENERTKIVVDLKKYIKDVYDFLDLVDKTLKVIIDVPIDFSQVKEFFNMDILLFIMFMIGTRETYYEEEIRFLNEVLDTDYTGLEVKNIYEREFDKDNFENNILCMNILFTLSENMTEYLMEEQINTTLFLEYNCFECIKDIFFKYVRIKNNEKDIKISMFLRKIRLVTYEKWYDIKTLKESNEKENMSNNSEIIETEEVEDIDNTFDANKNNEDVDDSLDFSELIKNGDFDETINGVFDIINLMKTTFME